MTLRKVKVQKEDGITEDEGMKINVKVVKNRVAKDNPYKATSYTVIYGEGIDQIRELVGIAQDMGIATSGSWIYVGTSKDDCEEWNGEKLAFNGKAKFLDFIRENEDFKAHLLERIRNGGSIPTDTLDEKEIEAIEEAAKQAELDFGEEEV